MTRITVVTSALLMSLASAAFAQAPMSFRLEENDRNPSSCSAGDAAMSRPQSVTVENNVAVLKSNGGINDKAKMASPGFYRTKWAAGGITYDIEINTTASPATMTVAELKLGCKWSGKAS
jgi:hypothetical protein